MLMLGMRYIGYRVITEWDYSEAVLLEAGAATGVGFHVPQVSHTKVSYRQR